MSGKFLTLGFLLLAISGAIQALDLLDPVSDEELVTLFKKEKYLIVLFTKRDCDQCDRYETILHKLKGEIGDSLKALIVKASTSQLARLYSPTKEPAVVFFRHGVPLLYDGAIDENEIFQRFYDNMEPTVKELSDHTFEHLTQAATGATTGDWLCLFYTQSCIDCQRLAALWEAVGAALKGKMNVARINSETSPLTAKRFRIQRAPEFILLRQGKFYRYEIKKMDIQSFVTFATLGYKNATPEKVVPPSTPFDDLVTWSVNTLKELIAFGTQFQQDHPLLTLFVGFGFVLTFLAAVVGKLKSAKAAKETRKKAK